MDICRFCHIQYSDLQENIHNYGPKQHEKWSKEEFDKAATQAENKNKERGLDRGYYQDNSSSEEVDTSEDESDIQSEEEDTEIFGVKHKCPLNDLQAFHCTSGFPPDILHDIFEGVVSQDLLGILRILKSKGWFTIVDYNASIKRMKFKSNEASDKPENVPESVKVK